MSRTAPLALALLLPFGAAAEPAYFVKEIRPGATTPWLSAPVMAAVGPKLLTYANDGVNGLEPWISDGIGNGTTLLMNIKGSGDSVTNAPGPKVIDGKAYFLADDGFLGFEPWVTDGTPAGTHPLADTGSGSANVNNWTRFRGKTYFIVRDDLWMSDGTAAGTTLAWDSPVASSEGSWLIVWKGRLRWLQGTQFMTSDGTAAGTTAGQSLPAGLPDGSFFLRAVNDVIYFTASDTAGSELWRTDWTTAGTTRVADLVSGVGSSSPGIVTRLDDRALFTANTPVEGRELWTTDGTAAGTVLVKDIRAGSNSAFHAEFTTLNGALYFTADDGVEGRELWRSDGTSAGTTLVRDIEPEPSPNSNQTRTLTRVGDRLLLVADDGSTGKEPWISDGTNAGTTPWEDIYPGSIGSSPRAFAAAGGRVFFDAITPGIYAELFAKNQFDSTAATFAECDVPETGMYDLDTENFTMALPAVGGTVSDLDLSFDISHTYVHDLTLTLTHVPSGTSSLVVFPPLTSGGASCSGDNLNVRLSQQASTSMLFNCTNTLPAFPRRAVRRPDASLAVFNGLSIAGPWRFTVADSASGDGGTVHEWCLHFTRAGDAVFADGFE